MPSPHPWLFERGPALETSRTLLAHCAPAQSPWPGWAPLTPLPSKGLLSWLQVEGPERQKPLGFLCAPAPASDSSFSPCATSMHTLGPPLLQNLPWLPIGIYRGKLKALPGCCAVSVHYYHLRLPSNTLSTGQTLAPALPPASVQAAFPLGQLKGCVQNQCLIDCISPHLRPGPGSWVFLRSLDKRGAGSEEGSSLLR